MKLTQTLGLSLNNDLLNFARKGEDMFNWFYASIGVAIGIAGGVFRGIIVNVCIVGFLIFSTTFGIQWGLIALGEVFIGFMVSKLFT